MRKVLAILLVLCMVCTMSVVAFAANPITKDTEQIGSTIVKTIGQGPTDPDVPGANEDYTVTIPAELIVPWDNVKGGSAQDVYTLVTHLAKGSTVTVTVSPFGEKALAMVLKDGTETIPATISGDASLVASTTGTMTVTLSLRLLPLILMRPMWVNILRTSPSRLFMRTRFKCSLIG